MSQNNSFEAGRNKRSKKAIIFDLDGTLADTRDLAAHHKGNWDDFRDHSRQAPAKEDIVKKVHKAKEKGRDVIILTARSANYRQDTKEWLQERGIPYDALLMRPVGDDRKDKIVKRDLLVNDVLPHFEVKKAYDDKKKNVKMFRREGIKAKHVDK